VAIYYGCPDKDYPVGGIRVIYRHVDLLNRNGFDAFVLHHYYPFRCRRPRRERACRFISDNYSPEREEDDLLAVWTDSSANPTRPAQPRGTLARCCRT
jgi:hypothetical protein